jgi:hypothetical protein
MFQSPLGDQLEQTMKELLNPAPIFELPSHMIKQQQHQQNSSPMSTGQPLPITTDPTKSSLQAAAATTTPAPFSKRSDSASTASLYSSHSTSSSSGRIHQQHYHIVKLPSTRHALLTGSRTLISGLGQAYEQDQPNTMEPSLPLCYLLDHPVDQDDVVIQSASGLDGHILVCLQERVTNIFKFIYNLR